MYNFLNSIYRKRLFLIIQIQKLRAVGKIQFFWVMKYILLAGFFAIGRINAQEPDYNNKKLNTVATERSDGRFSANAQLVSDGENLQLYIRINDPNVGVDADPAFSDHIRLWFGLAPEAFPKNFPYKAHPKFVVSASNPLTQKDGRSSNSNVRFFSIFKEFSSDGLDLQSFKSKYDYPSFNEIYNNSLRVPDPRKLREEEVHFGTVGLGLFPDNRSPILLNEGNHFLWETSMGKKLGDVSKGISYLAEKDAGGYTINAQISPLALGFVRLPQTDKVMLLIEVFDTGGKKQKAYLSLSTAPTQNEKELSARMVEVRLQNPLKTNFTQIPDQVFFQTGFFPIGLFARDSFVLSVIDSDALHYGLEKASEYFMEIKFVDAPFEYNSYVHEGIEVKKLLLQINNINIRAREREFLFVNNHLTVSDRVQSEQPKISVPPTPVFRFPSGKVGFITLESAVTHPFGLEPCGECIDISLNIYKLTPTGKEEVVHIFQGLGPQVTCSVNDQNFDGFKITGLELTQHGRFGIIRMDSVDEITKRRIKLSWDKDGENVKISDL